ncbi:MAG: hypothetical protein N2Z64_00945 [Dictyoglomus thermophilum]|uniref:Uncharacterized protein n=1 Tax=Dictyoglomus thermophilum TaxID=14 RepID=A0A7C3Q096_DICTH|nr:hypothetical protein [Dictyoglomus thermophilum]MCX7719827.1 hypothetical protein [Dictyoglomus thermophilum]TYT22719.1 hypothetical protein FY122_06455 [Dictyoglomus thermophilum]
MISCKNIIREDENFYTLKFKCTEDLVSLLKGENIGVVYKGDQNLLWDAILTDLAIYFRLRDSFPFRPFLHDEKLGTGDHRLIPFYEDNNRYVITEDYAGKLTGAVYINQDITYGLFYGVPIEPSEYKNLNFQLSWIADSWKDYKENLRKDEEFVKTLEDLGFSLNYEDYSQVTKIGPIANKESLRKYFCRNPKAEIYYLFSKSLGWYGVVPKYPEEISLSSVYINEELKIHLAKLFVTGVRGILKQVRDREKRKEILERARRIRNHALELLKEEISIADFQIKMANFIIKDVTGIEIYFDKTSEMLKIRNLEDYENKDFYYFFDLLLRSPETFARAYNTALNKAKLPLKRFHIKNNVFQPPYFLEVFTKHNGRNILTRCNIEIKSTDQEAHIRLFSPHCSSETITSTRNIQNARDFLTSLVLSNKFPNGFALIGKAGPFMAEMRRIPRVLAVPEEGSKYAPMVDYFLGELKKEIKDIPESHLLRINLNLLDNLRFLGDLKFKLPRFLSLYIGETEISAKEFSSIWRGKVEEAEKVLELIKGLEAGQYFHLANIILWEKGLMDLSDRSYKLLSKLKEKGYNREFQRLNLPESFLKMLQNLVEERRKIIDEIKMKKEEAPKELFEEREFLEYKILFLFAVLLRSLLQFEKSLKYLNYRPYTIILYLLSPEFLKELASKAEIYIEKVVFKI